MHLECTHDITLEAIHAVTSFYNIGEVPTLKKVTKMEMTKLTGSLSDQWAMTINTIKDDLVKYDCMVIDYQMFYANRVNFDPAAAVNVTYKIIKEDASFDLCTYL